MRRVFVSIRGCSTFNLSFLTSIDEKVTAILGKISENCFTIFLTLFNRFTPLVIHLFQHASIYYQACFSLDRQDFPLLFQKCHLKKLLLSRLADFGCYGAGGLRVNPLTNKFRDENILSDKVVWSSKNV